MAASKYIAFVLLFAMAFSGANAQTSNTKSTKSKTAAKPAPKPAAPTVEGKAVSIPIKSNAEANVSIFAGKREDLKKPQLKTLGGLSKNTLYIKENDVVCIISAAGKPISCVDIKPGTTSLEVNSSGNVITKK
jgi:hypothetical protein